MSNIHQLRTEIEKKLGREIEVEQVEPGKWLIPYFNLNLKNRGDFVGATPEEACTKLLSYLNTLGDTDGIEASDPG